MLIKKIAKQKNGKYKIFLDDNTTILTYDDVILKHNLLQNKVIDNKLLNELNNENNYYDVYNKTVKYISTKLRSLKEINNYLKKFNLEEKENQKIVKKLKEIGFINDEVFTKSFISDRFNLSKDGPKRIKHDLLKHDIEETLIDKYLYEIEEDDIISKVDKIINKKISSNKKYSNYILKQKLVNELTNLGYDFDTISKRIEDNLKNDTSILKKEFDKVYSKYAKKLDKEQLPYKIRQYLYQKGFKTEDINKLLNEKNA